jgi:hypothetical protein
MNFNFEDEIHIRKGECKTPLKKKELNRSVLGGNMREPIKE